MLQSGFAVVEQASSMFESNFLKPGFGFLTNTKRQLGTILTFAEIRQFFLFCDQKLASIYKNQNQPDFFHKFYAISGYHRLAIDRFIYRPSVGEVAVKCR